jgi:hypothetical protein
MVVLRWSAHRARVINQDDTRDRRSGQRKGGTPGQSFLCTAHRPPARRTDEAGAHPGDLGWIVHRHGVWQKPKSGPVQATEGRLARIVDQFTRAPDPLRERAIIARMRDDIVGASLVIRQSDAIG